MANEFEMFEERFLKGEEIVLESEEDAVGC